MIINKTGELFTGVAPNGASYMEIDTLVHKWNLMCRQGLHNMMPRYKDLDAEVGFVLQGQGDEQLPEQMLGAVRIMMVDPTTLPEWSPMR